MKQLLLTFLFAFLTSAAIAQCGNSSILVPGSLTPPGVGQSTTLTFNSGRYVLAYVQGGANYVVSTCGGTTGGGPSYDTQLTVYDDATGAFLGYNDDACGLQSTVNFTPSFCGYVRILLHQYSCNGSNLPWNVTMTQNTAGSQQTYTLPAVSSQTNISCFGLTNGKAQVSATGTTGAVRYSWAPSGGTASQAGGLSVGVYTVTVTDAVCKGTIQTYTITQPTLLTATGSQTNVSCFGGSNGLGRANVSGGTTPYTYSWSPSGGTGATSSGLPIGSYTNNITDANGCTTSTSVTITQPTALGISAASGSVSCFGGSNGTATVSVSGGTTPYTYDWTPGTPTGDGTSGVSGLTAGTWSCAVTDSKGCSISATVTITQPAISVTSSTAATNVSCFGGSSGTATITAGGGAAGYTYLWSTAATTSVITGQTAGVKTVTVTDGNGCTTTNSVTISQPATAVSSSTAAASVLCFGGNTGSATVTATGGTAGYTYLWSTAATTSVITGQTAGVKTVTVTDANGCTATNSVTINQPTALALSATANNPTVCAGSPSTLTATGSGGAGAITYAWNSGPATNTFVVNPVSTTIYTVNITDANSCTRSATVSVSVNALPVIAVNSGTLCNGNSFTMIPTGAATYTFSSGSAVVSPTITTSYSVTGTSALGCISSNTAVSTVTVSICAPAAALNFDGSNDAVSLGAFAVNGAAPRTVEFWMKAPNTGSFQNPFSSGTANPNQAFNIKVTPTGQLGFMGFNNDNYPSTGTVIADNTYHHIAITYDGATMKTYVDGTPEWTYAIALTTTGTNNFIGRSNHVGAEQYFQGTIDELRVWNVARTQCEINTFKKCEIPTTATGLLANYHFNQGFDFNPNPAVTTLTDASGNAYTGALTSFALNGPTSNWVAPGGVVSGSVTPLTLPASTVSATNVLCNGGTGTATVSASNGTPAYTYLWSNAATTPSISVVAGVYTNTVTDANACSVTKTVTITQPTAITTLTAAANVLCNGNSTGSATVTASGGTGALTYLWSSAQTTSVVTGLNAGVRTVTVTDANSCTKVSTVSITQPATSVSSATAVVNVLCNGNSTGSATVTASGGTAGYTYLWSTTATTSVITGQTAGVKTVTVTDANGCTTTNTVTISQPATAVSSSTAAASVLCFGGNTGSATVTATGGTAGYTYLWSTTATTSVITTQIAGVKTVTVTDANGCTTTNSVTITQPAAALSATQTQTNITCVINGRAAVSVSGGTTPYTYTWSPTGGNAAMSTTLTAGNYTCNITDANNCTFANTFTITANTVAPLVAVSGSTAICNGANATLTASGANTYTWNTGATTSTINVNPTATTMYSVTGTTAINGCTTSVTHTLIVNPNPTVTATSSSTVICTTQSATLTAGGATTYTWSTGSSATSIVVSPTITTTYTLNANGPTGCFGTTTVSLAVVNTPTVTAVSSSSAICAGASATLTASGANTYSWNTGPTTSTIVVTPASSITYTVNGMVSAGCNSNATVSIVVNANPTPSITVSQASVCPGQTSTLTASGASTYSWSTGSTATSITSTPVVATTYTVTGFNVSGCKNTATQTIGLYPAPSINLINIGSLSASVCAGYSATLIATGVNSYTWNTGSNGTGIIVSPTTTTSYSVNGTDVNGCAASSSITIGISVTPTVTAVASNTGVCSGFPSALSASGALTYAWNTGHTGNNISVSPTSTSVYTVIGTNGSGCIDTAIVNVTVYASPTVSLGADIEVAAGTDYQFNPAQSGATSYTWSPATYLSSTSVLNPIVRPESDVVYILTVGSVNGCTASDTIAVKALTDLVMANYMSPNGDGANDTWKVSVPGLIQDYSVVIIDSYGKTVFSVGNHYNNEFDGKLGGQDLPDGVYYYFIKDGNDTKFKGSITLTH